MQRKNAFHGLINRLDMTQEIELEDMSTESSKKMKRKENKVWGEKKHKIFKTVG